MSNAPRGAVGAIPVLLCLLLSVCATAPPPRAGDASPPRGTHHALADRLTALLDSAATEQALWAVFVRSLDAGDVLFAHHGDRLLMPASTMKIITLAVAAERLGWDYSYETRVLSAAAVVVDGVLRGDLIVRGSGDPTINTCAGHGMPAFDAWAATLLEAGTTAIDGRVIGDDDLVEDAAPGYGWSWDDLPYGYATPGGALQHHDNVAVLTVHPGSVAGEDVVIEVAPPANGVRVVNRVETVSPDSETELTLKRMPDGALEVLGAVPASAAPVYRTLSVQTPTVFFVRGLKQTLKTWGIDVSGDAVDLDEVDAAVVDGALRMLASHRSPPLWDIAGTLMGVSQNLYAETLLRTLDQDRQPRTAVAGRAV